MASPEHTTQVCDFTRSYIRWRSDTTKKPMLTVSQPPPTSLNNVRMPVECVVTVRQQGTESVFGLGTSCKTEQVFVERDVWMRPNADMCAVSSADDFLVIKRWDKVDKGVMLFPPSLGPQPERQRIDPALAFDTHALALRHRRARQLTDIHEIIEVLSDVEKVISRTCFSIAGFEVTVEYPVKTVNFSERHRYYQVDTGPVLFFDPSADSSKKMIEHLYLAYVAHLGGDWAEFIVSQPTPLEGHGVSVHHYSDVRRVAAQNSLWVVESS
ncbi:MAG TPA: hypothetical protein PLN52_06820 [Opitutaceae bacterium]|nr:hypothetical protein [Opitutaceae bacterium]